MDKIKVFENKWTISVWKAEISLSFPSGKLANGQKICIKYSKCKHLVVSFINKIINFFPIFFFDYFLFGLLT